MEEHNAAIEENPLHEERQNKKKYSAPNSSEESNSLKQSSNQKNKESNAVMYKAKSRHKESNAVMFKAKSKQSKHKNDDDKDEEEEEDEDSDEDDPDFPSVGAQIDIGICSIDDVAQTVSITAELIVLFTISPDLLKQLKKSISKENHNKWTETKDVAWRPKYGYYDLVSKDVKEPSYWVNLDEEVGYFEEEGDYTIRKAMDMLPFPFDRHRFTFNLFFENCCPEPYGEWYEEGYPREQNSTTVYTYDSGWLIYQCNEEFTDDDDLAYYDISVNIERVPNYYIINIVMIVFFLTLFSVTTAAVDYTDFSSRSGITLTLLLTSVAFKSTIASWTPKISYLTLLDKYVFASMLFLSVMIVENFLISLSSSSGAKGFDIAFSVIFALVWIAIHVVLGYYYRMNMLQPKWSEVIASCTVGANRIGVTPSPKQA